MQAIAGGLGPNGVLMVIGAVGPLTVNSLDLFGQARVGQGLVFGDRPGFGGHAHLQPAQQDRLDERNLPVRKGAGGLSADDERQGALPRRPQDGRLTSTFCPPLSKSGTPGRLYLERDVSSAPVREQGDAISVDDPRRREGDGPGIERAGRRDHGRLRRLYECDEGGKSLYRRRTAASVFDRVQSCG